MQGRARRVVTLLGAIVAVFVAGCGGGADRGGADHDAVVVEAPTKQTKQDVERFVRDLFSDPASACDRMTENFINFTWDSGSAEPLQACRKEVLRPPNGELKSVKATKVERLAAQATGSTTVGDRMDLWLVWDGDEWLLDRISEIDMR